MNIHTRLLPLPHQITCNGWRECRPEEIAVCSNGLHPTVRLAATELVDFLVSRTGASLTPRFGAPHPHGDGLQITIAHGPGRALRRDGFQCYTILPDRHGLRLIGREPIGAYYAVQTLKQAIEFRGKRVRIPLLRVTDWADLAERGFWDYFYPASVVGRAAMEMHTFQTREAWYAFLDDFADHKLNLLELLVTDHGLLYQSKRFPKLVQEGTPGDKNELMRDVLVYARARGIVVFLTIGHPEQIGQLRTQYPEIAARNPTGCPPSLFQHLYCFSQPRSRHLFQAIFEEVAEFFAPDGICVWSPEHLGRCTCSACQRASYPAPYFSLYREAFQRARRQHPKLRLRLLASFMRYSIRVLKTIPPEAEIEYYECDRHGLYGYDADKRLPEHLNAAARTGRRLVGCMSYRGCGQKYVPLPMLDNVAGWVRLLARKGWHGVSGSTYSNPGVNRLNLLRMADAGWNATGRNSETFLRAYGHTEGQPSPQIRASVLWTLSEGWELYHRISLGFLEQSALDWILRRDDVNYLDAAHTIDTIEYQHLPSLEVVLKLLPESLRLAARLGDRDLQRQLRVCQIRLQSLHDIFYALRVYGRQRWPDPEKGPWGEDWIGEIQRRLTAARRRLQELPRITVHIRSRYAGVVGDPAVRDEACLKRIDRILSPGFRRELQKRAWPDLAAFA